MSKLHTSVCDMKFSKNSQSALLSFIKESASWALLL